MPGPPRKTLLAAADSYPRWGAPENRLTEIFAEVLRTSPKLTAWLLDQTLPELADAVTSGSRHWVTTQFMLDGGSERPDMQISVENSGRYLYVENKLDAVLTPAQLNGYLAVGKTHMLLAIVPERRLGETFPDRFGVTTWQQVGSQAYKLGRKWGRQAWRLDALGPTAPGEYRLLAEFCRYLEEELGMSIGEPLERVHAEVLAGAEVALQRWKDLRDLVTAMLAETPGLRRSYSPTQRWHPYQDGRDPDKNTLGWELRLNAEWPALQDVLSPGAGDDWWQLGQLIGAPETSWVGGAGYSDSTPAFGAGISVRIDGDWPSGLHEGEPLRVACERGDFAFGVTRWRGGVTGRVFRTLRLSELEDAGSTIEEQAEYVATWTRAAINELRQMRT